MSANAAEPKVPDFKWGTKPAAKYDLKSLPMAEVGKKPGSSPDGPLRDQAAWHHQQNPDR
jgi:hypothetical protein